ncbi:MAG: hypothetical protein Q9220_006163 [cf. Caloplaca sp. 1 TL-2023]
MDSSSVSAHSKTNSKRSSKSATPLASNGVQRKSSTRRYLNRDALHQASSPSNQTDHGPSSAEKPTSSSSADTHSVSPNPIPPSLPEQFTPDRTHNKSRLPPVKVINTILNAISESKITKTSFSSAFTPLQSLTPSQGIVIEMPSLTHELLADSITLIDDKLAREWGKKHFRWHRTGSTSMFVRVRLELDIADTWGTAFTLNDGVKLQGDGSLAEVGRKPFMVLEVGVEQRDAELVSKATDWIRKSRGRVVCVLVLKIRHRQATGENVILASVFRPEKRLKTEQPGYGGKKRYLLKVKALFQDEQIYPQNEPPPSNEPKFTLRLSEVLRKDVDLQAIPPDLLNRQVEFPLSFFYRTAELAVETYDTKEHISDKSSNVSTSSEASGIMVEGDVVELHDDSDDVIEEDNGIDDPEYHPGDALIW